MTTHLDCQDCEFEAITDDTDEAVEIIDTHESTTGHRVDDERVDDGAKLVTDGGGAVIACPECDSAEIRTNNGGINARVDQFADHVCEDCGTEFDEDEAVEREPYHPGGMSEQTRQLLEADPDDLGKPMTDGGQASIPSDQYEHIAVARDALRKVDEREVPDDVAEFVEDAYSKFDWWHDRVEDDPDLVTDGGTEYDDPLEAVDGETEVEIECAVGIHAPRDCDGWCETVELDEPADYTGQFLELPGFNWECPECGNPNEFEVEGIRVSNLV